MTALRLIQPRSALELFHRAMSAKQALSTATAAPELPGEQELGDLEDDARATAEALSDALLMQTGLSLELIRRLG